MVLPLESYMENYPDTITILNGMLRIESKCMASYGFTIPAHASGANPPPSYDASNMARRYGVADLAFASKYGYHLAVSPPKNSSGAESASGAERTVLTGKTDGTGGSSSSYQGKAIPPGGCRGQALRELRIANVDFNLPQKLDTESMDRSLADPRVIGALEKWSSCMKSKGYTVDSPLHAPQLASSSQGPAPSAQEIEIAVADVQCKQSTNLVNTWFSVESQLEEEEIEKNQLPLSQERNQLNEAVKTTAALASQ
jgi:hypothetical protein